MVKKLTILLVSIVFLGSFTARAQHPGKTLLNVAEHYFPANIDSAKFYAKQAYRYFENKSDTLGLINASQKLLKIYKAQANVDSAKLYGYYAIELSEKINDIPNLIFSYIELGEFTRSIYRNDISDQYVKEGIRLSHKEKIYQYLPYAYNRLAAIYFEKFFDKSLSGDSAFLYQAMNFIDSSIYWSQKTNNFSYSCSNANIKGTLMYQLGNIDLGIEELKKALQLAKKEKNFGEYPYILMNIAEAYRRKGDLKLHENYLLQAARLVDSIKYQEGQWFVYNRLFAKYKKEKNYKKALDVHLVIDSLEAVALKKNSNKKMKEFKVEVESQHNKQLLEYQKKEIVQQHKIILLLASIFILLAVFVIILFRLFRKNVKQRHTLEKKNKEVERLLRFQESFRNMIVHDIKNPLSQILYLSSNNIIDNAARRILSLVNNILDLSKHESGQFSISPQWVETGEFLANIKQNLQVLFELKNIKLDINYTCKELFIDKDVITRVFENILNNAIRFSPVGERIRIDIDLDDAYNEAKVSITNWGPPIPDDEMPRIFEFYSKSDNGNIQNYRPTGLGLSFCKMAIEAHGFNIVAENVEPHGVRFWFKLRARTLLNFQSQEYFEKLTIYERNTLEPYIEELCSIEINETSKIINILEKIPDSKNIDIWKKQIENAVFNSDTKEFNKLITFINTSKGKVKR
jgi:signal transduction histidine kinase